MPRTARPVLARHVRLSFDEARQRHILLRPESVVVLNRTGADILALCDGQRTVADIIAELNHRYDNVGGEQVDDFLTRLAAKRCVEITGE